MASIATYLQKIKSAIYGEEVRDSIHDAINAMNEEVEGIKSIDVTVDHNEIVDLKNAVNTIDLFKVSSIKYGYIGVDGVFTPVTNQAWVCIYMFPCNGADTLIIKGWVSKLTSGSLNNVWAYDADGNSLGGLLSQSSSGDIDTEISLPTGTAYISLCNAKSALTNHGCNAYLSSTLSMIESLDTDLSNNVGVSFTVSHGLDNVYFETDDNEYLYIKITGIWYLRGKVANGDSSNFDYTNICTDNRYTSPSGVTDCIRLASNDAIVYDTSDNTFKIKSFVNSYNPQYITIFKSGYYKARKSFGVVSGIGQYLYLSFIENQNIDKATMLNKYGTFDYSSQAENVIDKAIKDKDSHTITFGLITDAHYYSSYNPLKGIEIFNRLSEKCCDFVINLGDSINGYGATLDDNLTYLSEYCRVQNDTWLPSLYTIAHHEMYGVGMKTDSSTYMNDSTGIPYDTVIGMCTNNKYLNEVTSDNRGNWYIDLKDVRLIGLDSVHNTTTGFNQETIEFLTDAVNTEKKLIVFAHVPANANVNWKNRTVQRSDEIESLLDTANVIAYFHGHTHWDNTVVVNGNTFPYISTCCALAVKQDSANFCNLGTPTVYDRVVGEYSEYCFDIVNVHVDTGTIKSFRFGAGYDRTYTQSV